jgi:hypothetical protein
MSGTFKTWTEPIGYTGRMSTHAFESARRFILVEGRLLERRVMAALFDGADPAGALDALAGYRNEDGGLGYGLEPDKRAPTSQPLDVEAGFHVMDSVGRIDGDLVLGCCNFLQRLGPGVGCLVPSALEHAKAHHWGDQALAPSLNPTAGLVALLWKWDVDHPWRGAATEFCWEQLEAGLPKESHTFGEVLAFLDAVPDRARADVLVGQLRERVPALEVFHLEPGASGYGLTPLHFAPTPKSRWCELFDQQTIDGHLGDLAADQCDDGGWPISWETVGTAAEQEWRGIETLRAIRTLSAYGRL